MGVGVANSGADQADADPAVAPVRLQDTDLDGAENAYLDLMAAYNRALGRASHPVGSQAGSGMGSTYLTRLMVKTHIRARLKALAAAYAEVAAAIEPASENSPARRWLDGAREDCERIATALPAIRFRPLLLAVISPAAALLSITIPGWLGYALLALAGAIPTFVVLAYMTTRSSYRGKRQILMPGALKIDEMPENQQVSAFESKGALIIDNAYLAENLAFGAIGRDKRLETQLDRSIKHAGLLLLAEGTGLLPLFLWDGKYWWVTLIVAALTVAGSFILGKFEKNRAWL
jgi:hypothetical protein